jgi:hypothetical protein
MLSFFVTAGVLVGFDASGHVAEETNHASLNAARGVFYSALASGVMGFPMVILFLFCTPNLNTLYSFDSPQPFVNLYALALGQHAHCIMNTVAIVGLVLVSPPSCGTRTEMCRIRPSQSLPLPGLFSLLLGTESCLGRDGSLKFQKMDNLKMRLKSSGRSQRCYYARSSRHP